MFTVRVSKALLLSESQKEKLNSSNFWGPLWVQDGYLKRVSFHRADSEGKPMESLDGYRSYLANREVPVVVVMELPAGVRVSVTNVQNLNPYLRSYGSGEPTKTWYVRVEDADGNNLSATDEFRWQVVALNSSTRTALLKHREESEPLLERTLCGVYDPFTGILVTQEVLDAATAVAGNYHRMVYENMATGLV